MLAENDFVEFRVRLLDLLSDLVSTHSLPPFSLNAGYPHQPPPPGPIAPEPKSPEEVEERRSMFTPIDPAYRFDQVVLPAATLDRLEDCIAFLEVSPLVFDEWNLRSIEPNPSIAVSFRGPPGTGKTMAAHALAGRMGKSILLSRLSDLESKYHGDGPKNLVSLFESAAETDSVLFLDEAESLLSRRYENPSQAAESAINSMRTELLMALDAHEGLVIFASNLSDSYDAAIASRLFEVHFPLPDLEARRRLWQAHLPEELPIAEDVAIDSLAAVADLTGRDIKQAIVSAAISSARKGHSEVTVDAIWLALEGRSQPGVQDTPADQVDLTDEDSKANIAAAIRHKLSESTPESGQTTSVE